MAKLKPPVHKKIVNRDSNTLDIEKTISTATPKNLTDQPSPTSIVPIQLKIPEMKRNEFKAYAALRGRAMNTLFLEMFEEYKKNHA